MKKHTFFLHYHHEGWPKLEWLERFFLTDAGRREAFGEQESWGLKIYGIEGTGHLERYKDRVDLDLTIQGDLRYGVMFFYHVAGGGRWVAKYSSGDTTRWRQWVETPQGDHLSVALFVSFEVAWNVIKEFIQQEGALPKCIEWIMDKDLPDYAFRPDVP